MEVNDSEDDFIELTTSERDALRIILEGFLLRQSYKNKRGVKSMYMRQHKIWINNKNFLQNNTKPRGVNGLLRKKILHPHPILGYYVCIKETYLSQIYNLLDNGDWDLALQLSGVWLEVY